MFHRPATPYTDTKTRRRDIRRLVRGYLGTSSEAAPTLEDALRAADELKRLIDLASGGRYGLAVVRSADVIETCQYRAVEQYGDGVAADGSRYPVIQGHAPERERSSRVHEPINETIKRERALRRSNEDSYRWADFA